jgi:hypothetical protein
MAPLGVAGTGAAQGAALLFATALPATLAACSTLSSTSRSAMKQPKANRRMKDARLICELMQRAGLDVQAAAREIEINDKQLLSYLDGEPVPRYVILALMTLADLAETAAK